jgi:uncharacterized small protein (DUF1192 family)
MNDEHVPSKAELSDALRSRVDSLTSEVQRLKDLLKRSVADLDTQLSAKQADIERLKADLESTASRERALREALEPFARWAKTFNASLEDDIVIHGFRSASRIVAVTIGDYRRACAALSARKPEVKP